MERRPCPQLRSLRTHRPELGGLGVSLVTEGGQNGGLYITHSAPRRRPVEHHPAAVDQALGHIALTAHEALGEHRPALGHLAGAAPVRHGGCPQLAAGAQAAGAARLSGGPPSAREAAAVQGRRSGDGSAQTAHNSRQLERRERRRRRLCCHPRRKSRQCRCRSNRGCSSPTMQRDAPGAGRARGKGCSEEFERCCPPSSPGFPIDGGRLPNDAAHGCSAGWVGGALPCPTLPLNCESAAAGRKLLGSA